MHVNPETAKDHEQQSARCELVVAAQNTFENFAHSLSAVETNSSSSISCSLLKFVRANPPALRAGLVGMISAMFSICSRVGTFLLLKSVQSATLKGTARSLQKQQKTASSLSRNPFWMCAQ